MAIEVWVLPAWLEAINDYIIKNNFKLSYLSCDPVGMRPWNISSADCDTTGSEFKLETAKTLSFLQEKIMMTHRGKQRCDSILQ